MWVHQVSRNFPAMPTIAKCSAPLSRSLALPVSRFSAATLPRLRTALAALPLWLAGPDIDVDLEMKAATQLSEEGMPGSLALLLRRQTDKDFRQTHGVCISEQGDPPRVA